MRYRPHKIDFSRRLEIQRLLDLLAFRIAEKDAIDRNCTDSPPTKRTRINKILILAKQAAEAWDNGERTKALELLRDAHKVDCRWRAAVSVSDGDH